MASTEISTATTPAMPMTITRRGAEPLRQAARLIEVTAPICLKVLMSVLSAAGERVDDVEPLRAQRRRQPGDQREQQSRRPRRCQHLSRAGVATPMTCLEPGKISAAQAQADGRGEQAQQQRLRRAPAAARRYRRSRASSARRTPGMRSRTDCIIVLPVRNSSVKNTAPRIARTMKLMSPTAA